MSHQHPYPYIELPIHDEHRFFEIFLNKKPVSLYNSRSSWDDSDKLIPIEACLLSSLFYLSICWVSQ